MSVVKVKELQRGDLVVEREFGMEIKLKVLRVRHFNDQHMALTVAVGGESDGERIRLLQTDGYEHYGPYLFMEQP